jgi:hypothetical protein
MPLWNPVYRSTFPYPTRMAAAKLSDNTAWVVGPSPQRAAPYAAPYIVYPPPSARDVLSNGHP